MKVGKIKELTCSQTELSKALGLTTGRITQLIDEGVVIRNEADKSGGVMLFESLKNYYQTKASSKDELDYWSEKAKHEKVKREISELKYRQMEGSVYEAKIVELVMSEQLVTIKTKLLSIPNKISGRLENRGKEEIYEELTAEIEEALKELTGYKAEMFEVEVKEEEEE